MQQLSDASVRSQLARAHELLDRASHSLDVVKLEQIESLLDGVERDLVEHSDESDEFGDAELAVGLHKQLGSAAVASSAVEKLGSASSAVEQLGSAVAFSGSVKEQLGSASSAVKEELESAAVASSAVVKEELVSSIASSAVKEELGSAVASSAVKEELGSAAVASFAVTEELVSAVASSAANEELGSATESSVVASSAGVMLYPKDDWLHRKGLQRHDSIASDATSLSADDWLHRKGLQRHDSFASDADSLSARDLRRHDSAASNASTVSAENVGDDPVRRFADAPWHRLRDARAPTTPTFVGPLPSPAMSLEQPPPKKRARCDVNRAEKRARQAELLADVLQELEQMLPA